MVGVLWGVGGKGKETTGGQERSTARRGHNRESAAGCLRFHGLLGDGAGYGKRRPLVFTRGCEVGREDRQSRASWSGCRGDKWFPQQCLGVQGQR